MEKGGVVVAGMGEVEELEGGEEVMFHTMKTTVMEVVEDVVGVREGLMEVRTPKALGLMEVAVEDTTVTEMALKMRTIISPFTANAVDMTRLARVDIVMKVTKRQNGGEDVTEGLMKHWRGAMGCLVWRQIDCLMRFSNTSLMSMLSRRDGTG